MPLLSVRDLTIGFERDAEGGPVVDGVSFDLDPGEVVSLVGESGIRQDVDRKIAVAAVAQGGADHPGHRDAGAPGWQGRSAASELSADAGAARNRDIDDLPRADERALAGAPGRRSGRRGAEHSRLQGRCAPHSAGHVHRGRLSQPGIRLASLSVRAIRRPAPARRDRHGDGRQSRRRGGRRADHRAGRDDPGDGAEHAEPAAPRPQHRGDPDHPRSGRGRQHGGQCRGDAQGQSGRKRRRAHCPGQSRTWLYAGADRGRADRAARSCRTRTDGT